MLDSSFDRSLINSTQLSLFTNIRAPPPMYSNTLSHDYPPLPLHLRRANIAHYGSMLSLHLAFSDTVFNEDDLSRISGSRPLKKAVFEPIPTSSSSGQSEARQQHSQRTHNLYQTHLQGPFLHIPPSRATTFPDTPANGKDIAARRAHNAVQPIARLSADIVEYLFLLGASLTSTSGLRHTYASVHSSSSIHHRDSPTRTILTYAQLTSSLRHTALSSPRLWARLIDFEHASSRWTDELLRRSASVGLQIVFQWSQALGPFHSAHGTNSDALVHESRKGHVAKKARMESMLRREVLERARSIGIAVPAPYFADVLLDTLAGFGNGSEMQTLDRLKSLRIIRSQPRKIFEEEGRRDAEADNEETDRPAGYVPFAILDAAPKLRELAIAESCLPFHDLLPYLASSPSPLAIVNPVSDPSSLSPQRPFTGIDVRVLHTLSHLRSLHIADLSLHLAPSAHEWLVYLCSMPSLEELVLEGAVLAVADLGARAKERTRLHGKTDMSTNWLENEHGNATETHVSSDRLPYIRVLTLDAALEDIGALVAVLPLPPLGPNQRNTAAGARQYTCEWTLRCANSRMEEAVGLAHVMNVLSRAASVADVSPPRAQQGPLLPLSLAISATGHELHVQQQLSSLGPCFLAHLHFHMYSGAVATPAPLRAARPAASLAPAVLGHLEAVVLPRTTCLDLDLPPLDDIAPLRSSLAHAKHVVRLGLAAQGAKSVLQLLRDATDARRASIGVCGVDAAPADLTSARAEPGPDAVMLLPTLKVLALSEEGCVGPIWTSLIRCVKARRTRAPMAGVEFGSLNGRYSLLTPERVNELQDLGVLNLDVK